MRALARASVVLLGGILLGACGGQASQDAGGPKPDAQLDGPDAGAQPDAGPGDLDGGSADGGVVALAAYQQNVLYDLRGTDVSALMLDRTILLINKLPTAAPAQLVRTVSQVEAQRLDLEMEFPVYVDATPPGLELPPKEQVQRLDPPVQSVNAQGQTELRWAQTQIAPGGGVYASYGGLFQRASDLVQGDTAVFPHCRARSQATLEAGALTFEYQVTPGAAALHGFMFDVAVPHTIAVGGGDPSVVLYDILDIETTPTASQILRDMTFTDGRFETAEGIVARFMIDEVAADQDVLLRVRLSIRPSGSSGQVVPYLTIGYHAWSDPAQDFTINAIPSNVAPIPTVHVCSVGWPDPASLSF